MFSSFADLAQRVLAGERLGTGDALAILASHDDELIDLVAAAASIRRAYFGNTVTANYLVNLKSGLCPEDCSYCSQRLGSTADIPAYSWLKPDEAVAQASAGIHAGATRVCLVSSGRGPSDRDVSRVSAIAGRLKEENPDLEVCACLGLLKEGQAERLRAAGVDAYNHNLNTAGSRYDEICSTHSYEDRVGTVQRAKQAGLSPCSGLIAGLGESDAELVEAVFALRELGSDSIPVNFLMPFEGTPLGSTWQLTPARCLRILALVRFAAPDTELRIAGGRELHLRSLQPLALHIANSLFLGDYLTSEGQATREDLAMIADGGFVLAGAGEHVPAGASAHAPGGQDGPGACAGTDPGQCGGGCRGAASDADPAGSAQAPGHGHGGCGGRHGHEEHRASPAAPGVLAGAGSAAAGERIVHAQVRRRGPGTGLPPNA